jgi:hypothetical protein
MKYLLLYSISDVLCSITGAARVIDLRAVSKWPIRDRLCSFDVPVWVWGCGGSFEV